MVSGSRWQKGTSSEADHARNPTGEQAGCRSLDGSGAQHNVH